MKGREDVEPSCPWISDGDGDCKRALFWILYDAVGVTGNSKSLKVKMVRKVSGKHENLKMIGFQTKEVLCFEVRPLVNLT